MRSALSCFTCHVTTAIVLFIGLLFNSRHTRTQVLQRLLVHEFGLITGHDRAIQKLTLPDYISDYLLEENLTTVGDAVLRYSLGDLVPGMGNHAWRVFFNECRRTS